MEDQREQLRRVLQLALHSPYEGERAKAVALLLQRLETTRLTLADLDASFNVPFAENVLKERADLVCDFEVLLKSREEALLYSGLIEALVPASVTWLEGHHLLCRATPSVRRKIEALFQQHVNSLQRRLIAAQKQAMQEYQVRRQILFERAVTAELENTKS
ncbi:hypothetical protein EHF33_20360 (plasmid) [Deinococcus psychrotolerans]|uniref:Uncharacterized protein n=1 Tax=Deinococcus psychrotolerans TaxID=2489213 RepID=A0A3G8YUH3_9DEIO|nr:hypothetical protein [Deinococcus psychrotolerans]AZI45261.1 hypothetical protein EHF33_20360 [Deinococcus psychrotolerans]